MGRLLLLIIVCSVIALGVVMVVTVQAQSTMPSPRTDPSEARTLNTILSRWWISDIVGWDINGEFCTGAALDATPIADWGIKCDCSYSANTTCHITALRVIQHPVPTQLPEELWNLTYLTYIDLEYNNLTGSIPASISNLTHLRYLSLAQNALSGELPRELGLLTDLRSLSLRNNNFSGPLPPELGNLPRLTRLYFDSSGVSGPIPLTFANLSMEELWASNNELTGQIPEFIGNWSNLTTLRLQGNSFEGPIPSSFSGLASLTDLRISDLIHGSSSLDFLQNMNNLSTLVLRNNNISGAIPAFLEDYPIRFQNLSFWNLSLVDFSFNRLTGTIPQRFIYRFPLTHVFLGNNMLTGGIPEIGISSLQTLDLSYNQLSGSLPLWISTQPNLRINLVANNFTVPDLNRSSLASGLDCLQRNFPCGLESPMYSGFAINCGGPEITASDGLVYEMDLTIGPAIYYVTSTHKWAVSNVGFPSTDFPDYRFSSGSQVTNTSDPELFQTARISAGSLRYYGLGLENGNYTVRLHFAETASSKEARRHIFDIYIQGNLEVRDFDMIKEAGGMLFRAVVREFTAQVTDNHLEIHLFWAGKGNCYLPPPDFCGPSISAISVTSDFTPTVGRSSNRARKRNQTSVTVGIVVAFGATSLFSLFVLYYVYQRRKKQKNFEDEELLGIDARPYTYTYGELKAATGEFNAANKLGEGGFGPVYKGTLEDGRLVAVKSLSVTSHHGKTVYGRNCYYICRTT